MEVLRYITEKFRICQLYIRLKPGPQNLSCSLHLTVFLMAVFSAKSLQGRNDGLWSAQNPFQPYKNTLIGSAWVISPSTCTFHWFQQSSILLWASLGHMCTSVGHGSNVGRKLNGGFYQSHGNRGRGSSQREGMWADRKETGVYSLFSLPYLLRCVQTIPRVPRRIYTVHSPIWPQQSPQPHLTCAPSLSQVEKRCLMSSCASSETHLHKPHTRTALGSHCLETCYVLPLLLISLLSHEILETKLKDAI